MTGSKVRGHPRKRGTSAEGEVNVKAATRDVSELVAESSNPSRPRRFSSHRLDEIRLRRVLDYIAGNLDEGITIAQLASVICLSPSHFATMFSRTMGVAPHRYVSRQRLESAKMMLADGKRSLRNIAVSCQFSSQSSFNRAFHREIGVTPGEYRRARVEERYLALRPDWVEMQQVHRHSEDLPQDATSIPEMVVAALSVTEASPALLWSSPPDGATDYLNAAWLAHFGLSREQAQGKGWQSLIHHDDHKGLLDAWLASVKTGNPFSVVSRMRCRDGQYHRILNTANPVRDAFGRIVRWSGTNLDLDNVVGAIVATEAGRP